MDRVCYWTVANNEYVHLASALVFSARKVGVTEDFLVFGDREVRGAKFFRADIPPSERWGCWFKFRFLERFLVNLDYDYFVWLHSENFFVRKPRSVLSLMCGSPMHCFLECDIGDSRNSRKDWWGCPNKRLVELYRERGVISEKCYNVNGGFFVIKRSFISEFIRIVDDFYEFCLGMGFRFVDEVPLAYVMQLVCGDCGLHTSKFNRDFWNCDWVGNWVDKIPDGSGWWSEHYMTGVRELVNPDVVHAMRCKDKLIEYGKHAKIRS